MSPVLLVELTVKLNVDIYNIFKLCYVSAKPCETLHVADSNHLSTSGAYSDVKTVQCDIGFWTIHQHEQNFTSFCNHTTTWNVTTCVSKYVITCVSK